MVPLTAEFVARATGSTLANAERFLPFLQSTCRTYEINTPRRVAAFLSQIGHESGGMARLQESLNYSVEGLLRTFGRHRISEADARRFGRNDATGQRANQTALADILYGGQWGRNRLGNTQPGDGSLFIGRGLKQLTGRDNYTRCGSAIGLDLVGTPTLLLEPGPAALSAGWFWSTNGCNALADRGDMVGLTKRINGGDLGLKERTALFEGAMRAMA